MKSIYALFFLAVLQSCYKEEIIYNAEAGSSLELPTLLKINGKDCCFDYIENSLRYPIGADTIYNFSPFIEYQEFSAVYFEGNILQNGKTNNLGKIEIKKEYSVTIESKGETRKLSLTFTNIPIVQIIAPNKICDEPKTLAKIIVNYANENIISDKFCIGIEYRGGSSQAYEKKSYGFSLKGSVNLNDDISDSFFGMGKNNDWILDAMWMYNARMRNKTSFEIWKSMHKNHYGINAEFVELYLNNEHHGLYCLQENINAEFLNLTNPNAVLYKATEWENGATCFEKYNSNQTIDYYWDGWEQKHPDPNIVINWQPLGQLRNLAVNENDENFTSQIESIIDLNNLIDYYIFLNIVSALDNTGKNTFLAKENTEGKLYIIPWDIDASWGLYWDGTNIDYTNILSNNLYDRLIETNSNDFKGKAIRRWSTLRKSVFSNTELKRLFIANFSVLKKSDIILIENMKWDASVDINSEQAFIINWIDDRVSFLDNYFENL